MVKQAAKWVSIIGTEDNVSAANRAEFVRWLEADDTHKIAYERLLALWNGMASAGSEAGHAAIKAAFDTESTPPPRAKKNKSRTRRKGALPFIAALTSGSLVWAFLQSGGLADYRTAIGERRTLTLEDGSVAVLNSGTAVDLDFDNEARRLTLRRGEVLISVAPGGSNPFFVVSASSSSRAMGTRYLVQRVKDADIVTVIDSHVEVCPARAGKQACRQVNSGERVMVTDLAVATRHRIDAAAAQSWVQGQIAIDDRPLGEVLDELQRYRRGYIHFDRKSLEAMHVSGVFSTDDTTRALDALAEVFPIVVKHYSPLLTVVSAR